MGKNESIYLGAKKVENINSTKYEDFLRDIDPVSVVSKLDYLINIASKIPLYFVNEEIIDLLCPPEPKIDLSRSRSWMDLGPNTHKNRPCIGVFVPNFKGTGKPEYDNVLRWLKYPSIFICLERVYNQAKEENVSLQVSFESVYYHELGHAYFYYPNRDTNSQENVHYFVISESLANAVAYERFRSEEEIAQFLKIVSGQSAAYRGYVVFVNFGNYPEGGSSKKPLTRDVGVDLQKIEDLQKIQAFEGITPTIALYPEMFRPVIFRRIWQSEFFKDQFFKDLADFILDEV